MDTLAGAWTESQLTDFLEETQIPIRLATHRRDGSLWIVTLWYRYRDGRFECATGANADIVAFLRDDPTVGFDISTNRPPYRGVRGNGTASLAPDTNKELLKALIERYLGDTDSSLAQWLLDDSREEVQIRIDPAAVYTWDYTDRMEVSDSSTE